MSKDTMEKIKQHYLKLRKDIVAGINLKTSGEIDIDGDDIDQIQGKAISAIAEHLSHRDLMRLSRIDAALAKIADGTFGQCEECGTPIGERRLIAIPGVETCVQCAEELERQAFAFA
jgi:DnaK suppressor protein